MKTTRDYKGLKVWQKADLIFDMVSKDVANWQATKIANSISYQLLRATGSISANIAEGYGRGLPGEFEQFLRYARGSAAEADNWLLKAKKANLITDERYTEYQAVFEETQKMIGSFISKLRLQPRRKL